MTILEELKADLLYNEQHPVFAPFDDDKLGNRYSGRYEKILVTDTKFKRWIFDNGNHYTLDLETKVLLKHNPIPPDYFIHKWIEKCIYDLIINNTKQDSPRIFCSENEIETKNNPLIIVRILVDREKNHICVTNILIQMNMRHNGYGKKLLNSIYFICKKFGYRLFLTEMVHSFYERMVARGAKVIELENIVEITDETILT